MPLQDFIINVYCLIDKVLKSVVHQKIAKEDSNQAYQIAKLSL